METLKGIGESFKSGKGFMSFNGTLAGLGAPILRPIAYQKINCRFYNKKYLIKQQNINVENLLKPKDQFNKYKTQILERDLKESFERTYYLKDDSYLNGFWFPIGLANNLTQYAEAAKAVLFNKLFLKDNIVSDIAMLINDFLVLKPILVRSEALNISSFVQKKKERLNSFEDTVDITLSNGKEQRKTTKYYEYNDIEGKEYSFNVELFTVMNNLWVILLQKYLKQWTQTASKDATEINRDNFKKENKVAKQAESIQNYASNQFLTEAAYPDKNNCLFDTGSYIVYSYQNLFQTANNTEQSALSYLFDYYNDAFFLTNLKLTSYNITKNSNGDSLNISLQFDKTIASERVFNYEAIKKNKPTGKNRKNNTLGADNEDKNYYNQGTQCVGGKEGVVIGANGKPANICTTSTAQTQWYR